MREDIITTYAQFIQIYVDEPAVREIFCGEEIPLLKASDSDDAVKLILLLISGYQGNRTANNFRKRNFAAALESLGITGKAPHSTRHTFANLAVRAGVKPEALRAIIGHANYSATVEIYAHANLLELKEELAKISGLSQNAGSEG